MRLARIRGRPLAVVTVAVSCITCGFVSGVSSTEKRLDVVDSDTEGPKIIVGSPVHGTVDVRPSARVFFVVSDDEAGVDTSSVTVLINGSPPAAITFTGDPSAFAVVTDPAGALPTNSTVRVSVTVHDLATPPNATTISWSFSTGNKVDISPPIFFGHNPGGGATGVDPMTRVTVGVRDESSIDLSTISFHVNSVRVGETSTREELNGDVVIEYLNPLGFAPGSAVEIEVIADDLAANRATLNFSFETSSATETGSAVAIVPDGYWAGDPARPLEVRSIPPGWRVKIFSTAGLEVRGVRNAGAAPADWIWNFANNKGDTVAKSMYLIRVLDERGSVKKKGKFVVQRRQERPSTENSPSIVEDPFGGADEIDENQDTYLLTIPPSEGGTVTITPFKSKYTYGEQVVLTAVPNTGWLFTEWSGGLSGGGNPTTLMITNDITVTAIFTTGGSQLDAYGVSRWTLDETSGTLAQDSWGSSDGTLLNGPGWRPTGGDVNGALEFDGANDYVDLGTMDVPNRTGFAIAFWFRANDFEHPNGRFISKATGTAETEHYWMVSAVGSTGLRFRLKAGGVTTTLDTSTGEIQTGLWYHITATYDGSKIRIWKNGTVVAETNKTGIVDTNSSVHAALGNQPAGAGTDLGFDGLLDDVRIYNRALTSTEIGSLIALATNSPPLARFTATPTSGFAPLEAAFNATASSDPENNPLSFSWNFGDGTTGTGSRVVHEYDIAGTHQVLLTVSDDGGKTDTEYRSINVNESTGPPSMPAWQTLLETAPGCAALTWQPNTESHLAGYVVYYGPLSVANGETASYADSLDVGNMTTRTICGFSHDTRYFALRAYNSERELSRYSAEERMHIEGPDLTSPIIIIARPENGAVRVDPLGTSIFFVVSDDRTGVDTTSVVVLINKSTPAHVTFNGDPSRYAAVCEPNGDLPPSTKITVSVSATDRASPPNVITKNWSFTTKGSRDSDPSVSGLNNSRLEALSRADDLRDQAQRCQDKGDLECADSLFQEVLGVRQKYETDELMVAISKRDVAGVLRARGDYVGAERNYREALGVTERELGRTNGDVADCLSDLAHVLQDRGDFVAAEPLFREALDITRALGREERSEEAVRLQDLGELLEARGEFNEAAQLYEAALEIYSFQEPNEDLRVVRCTAGLARALQNQGKYDDAKRRFEEALELVRRLYGDATLKVEPKLEEAEILASLAWLRRIQGDLETAETLLREALANTQRAWKPIGDHHPDVARFQGYLGELLEARGHYSEARSFYEEALKIQRKFLGASHMDLTATLTKLGRLRYRELEYRDAARYLGEAVEAYEGARLIVGYGYVRATFRTSPYPYFAGAQMALGRPQEAWQAVEKGRGRVLADMLFDPERRPLTADERKRKESIVRSIADHNRRINALRESAEQDPKHYREELFTNLRELSALEGKLVEFLRNTSDKYTIQEGGPFSLERIQKSLSKHDAIIGWLDVPLGQDTESSWAYVIRDEGPVKWARVASPPPGKAGLESPETRCVLSSLLRTPAESTDQLTALAEEIYGERIGPATGALYGVDNLIVIPSGPMLGIPVEILVRNDGSTVGDSYNVSYAPSATIQTWLAEKPKLQLIRKDVAAFLIGDPPFNDEQLALMSQRKGSDDTHSKSGGSGNPMLTFSCGGSDSEVPLDSLVALPGTRSEVQKIAAMFSHATKCLGSDASEETCVSFAESGRMKDFGVIHFATHALVNIDRPERSKLVLSRANLSDPLEAAIKGEPVFDGVVTPDDVFREWTLNADLVVLSACNTALGQAVEGEGYVGFANAFLQAGARSVLASLWGVDDLATSLLMTRFYEDYLGEYFDERDGLVGEPMSKTESLREAKQWLKKQKGYTHPYFWSAFILIGDRR